MPGASSAKNPQLELVVGPVKAVPVRIEPPLTVPIVNKQNSSNSSGGTNKNTSQNQSKQSKVEKSTKTESVGN